MTLSGSLQGDNVYRFIVTSILEKDKGLFMSFAPCQLRTAVLPDAAFNNDLSLDNWITIHLMPAIKCIEIERLRQLNT